MSKNNNIFPMIIFCVSVLLGFIASSSQAACTAITSLPYAINEAGPNNGSYCLTGNLTTSITSGDAITISSADNVSLDLGGFEIKATTPSSGNHGIFVMNSSNVLIKNGSLTGFRKGIVLNYGEGNSKGVVIEGITITIDENSGRRAYGLETETEEVIIRNCKITGAVHPPEGTSNAILVRRNSSARIVNNDIYNIFGKDAAIYSTKGNVVIENNRIEGVSSLPKSRAIHADSNALIFSNRIINMDFGITCKHDCTYRDNLTTGATKPYPTNNPMAIDAGNNK